MECMHLISIDRGMVGRWLSNNEIATVADGVFDDFDSLQVLHLRLLIGVPHMLRMHTHAYVVRAQAQACSCMHSCTSGCAARICTCTSRARARARVCSCVWVCMRVHACVFALVHACAYMSARVCVHVHAQDALHVSATTLPTRLFDSFIYYCSKTKVTGSWLSMRSFDILVQYQVAF